MDSDRPRRRTGRGEWQRRRILEFVPEFARREGYSPSQREIAEGLGLGLATVNYHVSVLEQDGSLHRGAGQPRTAHPGRATGTRRHDTKDESDQWRDRRSASGSSPMTTR